MVGVPGVSPARMNPVDNDMHMGMLPVSMDGKDCLVLSQPPSL